MQPDDGIPMHKVACMCLRMMGNLFIAHGGNLALSLKQTGTYCWEPFVNLHQEAPLPPINLEIDQHLGAMDYIYC